MNSNIKLVIIFSLILLIVLVGMIFLRSSEEVLTEEEEYSPSIEEPAIKETFEKRILSVLDSFIGKPQKSGPLDENNLYREDFFDSTTLVLSVVAKVHNDKNPEDVMKQINYYPAGDVSYENRLHFSSYRNKISDYFLDITEEVGKGYVKKKKILLNKDRLIDIDWEEEIEIVYVPRNITFLVLPKLPSVCGVMFVSEGDEKIGLDVRGEGIVLNGAELVYASRKEGEVVKVDFLEYLENSDFQGVSFYRFIEIK